ncbi:hypothetical protein CUMW_271520 [Citrus unshiu]|uniref:Uncharacterized protein n=1 Tax=Citrus unshiu TaxID=55188 RepID=A0A2H5QYL9_CITUN|nr:hypothetical protein CUMW_271520 [Citrus unshiu]
MLKADLLVQTLGLLPAGWILWFRLDCPNDSLRSNTPTWTRGASNNQLVAYFFLFLPLVFFQLDNCNNLFRVLRNLLGSLRSILYLAANPGPRYEFQQYMYMYTPR